MQQVPIQADAHVASDAPGRLRARIGHPQRHRHLLTNLQQRLQRQPGVRHVDVNYSTGSLLVHYQPSRACESGCWTRSRTPGVLFSLGLGAVGVWQAFRTGLGIETIPAYTLIWFAFDTFWKFHRRPSGEAEVVVATGHERASGRLTESTPDTTAGPP
jgi:hypothetical protein